MCDYQGYEFGAGNYPDSVCVDGKLHDADDDYLNDEDIPCPICRKEDAIEWWAERNSGFVVEGKTEEEADAEARANAISLVNDIRANRGLAVDA